MRIGLWPQVLRVFWPPADLMTRSWICDALHIFVLANFAVAQPIYDRLRDRAVLFVDQSLGMPVAYLLVALLSVGGPAVIVLCEWLAGRCGPRYYEVLHRLMVGSLLFLLALPILKQTEVLNGLVVIGLAVLGAVWSTRLYISYRPFRNAVTLASLGLVIFPGLFLVQFSANFVKISPTSQRNDRWNPVPVVVLVLDEVCGLSLMTPEREIDEQRFPNFAALAASTTWFRNATSVNQNTLQAVPAILSGRYPSTPQTPVQANLPQNLFSVLTSNGYDQVVFEPVSVLALSSEATSRTPQGLVAQTTFVMNFLWRVYLFHVVPIEYHGTLPVIPKLWFGMQHTQDVNPAQTRGIVRYSVGDSRNVQFQHFLRGLDGSPDPTLYFMHLLLPHIPWCYLPSGSRYADDGENWELLSVDRVNGLPGTWGPDELELINNQQRHLLQLMYVDQLLGKFLGRLKETGLYDRCLLVITADHGISFRSNQPRRDLQDKNLDEILPIPLFVKLTGQRAGEINDRDVESVDIFPTIADVLGVQLGSQTDGWSMFDLSRPPRTHRTAGDFKSLKAVDIAITRSVAPLLLIRERFGEGAGPESLLQTSQIPVLLGRRVDSFKLATTAPLEMEFLRFGDEVREGSPRFVPCFFEGELAAKKTTAGPTLIAVAINGTIRAVTRTYRQPGFPSRQWSAMVPESAFHTGRNDVRFYQVTGMEPDWLLTPFVAVPSTRGKEQ